MAFRSFFSATRPLMMAAAKASTTTTTATATTGRGITKAVNVSPQLAKFIGSPEVSRSQAVKKVWEHIKSKNLQNPANKKEINCDDKLKTIFDGKDTVGFLEIARLLSQHFPKSG